MTGWPTRAVIAGALGLTATPKLDDAALARPAASVSIAVRLWFPSAKLALVTSHLGAWEDWDEVRKRLLGKPVYMETSFSIPYLGGPAAKDYVMFQWRYES